MATFFWKISLSDVHFSSFFPPLFVDLLYGSHACFSFDYYLLLNEMSSSSTSYLQEATGAVNQANIETAVAQSLCECMCVFYMRKRKGETETHKLG